MGIDRLERGISFFGGAIALVSAAIFIPHLLKNTTLIVTAKHIKGQACQSGYHLVASLCEKSELTHPSYWVVQFLLILVLGLAILLFAYLRRRVGVIVASLMLGLASGTAGLVFLFLGGWLGIRAFRLQKYGDPTFAGSSRRAREMGQARREGRAPAQRRTRGERGKTTPAAKAATAPAPSKRYTPKKQQRRR